MAQSPKVQKSKLSCSNSGRWSGSLGGPTRSIPLLYRAYMDPAGKQPLVYIQCHVADLELQMELFPSPYQIGFQVLLLN